jgi:hypothetical protein
MTSFAFPIAAPSKPRGQSVRAAAAMLAASMIFVATAGGAALAQRAAIENDFPLPPVLGGLKKGNVEDFENKCPGCGCRFRYEKPGWRADVFIYDFNIGGIPDGPNNRIVSSHMQQLKQAVLEEDGQKGLSKANFEISGGPGKPAFTCAFFGLHRPVFSRPRLAGGEADSYVCLTGAKKKFVKVRLTTRSSPRSRAGAEQFVSELANLLP